MRNQGSEIDAVNAQASATSQPRVFASQRGPIHSRVQAETTGRRSLAATSGAFKREIDAQKECPPPTFDPAEEWVQEYKKQFGTEPSFF